MKVILSLGFPGGSVVKNLHANAGDVGSIPGSDESPEEEGNAAPPPPPAPAAFLALGNPTGFPDSTEETGGLQPMGP